MESSRFSRLGPRARRALLRAAPEDHITCLLRLTPSADADAVRTDLAGHGVEVRSWNGPHRVVTAEVPAAALGAISDLPGVDYVEAAEPYGG